MKNTKKKVILSVCLAAIFACIAVVSGVMLALNLNKSKQNASSLATTDPDTLTTIAKLKLTTDRTSLTPGSSFTIHATLSADRTEGGLWYAVHSVVAPLKEDGTTDYELAQYFTLDDLYDDPLTIATDNGADRTVRNKYQAYTMEIADKFNLYNSEDSSVKKETGIFFYVAKSGSRYLEIEHALEFKMTVHVSNEFPLDKYTSVTFGLTTSYNDNYIDIVPDETHTQPKDQIDYTPQDKTYSANDITFAAKPANTKAEIDSIKFELDIKDADGSPAVKEYVIASESGEGVDYYFNSSNYCEITLEDTSDLDLLVYYPTMKEDSEGATVKAGATDKQTAVPSSLKTLTADGVEIGVTGTNRYLYIQATPENGNAANVKIYTVRLTFRYARLSNLTATSTGDFDSSITKYDLDLEATDGVFDPDTFAYTAYVPDGTTDTIVTSTLATDYGTSTTIKVIKDGAYQIVGNKVSVGSTGELYLRGINNGDTLSFELTAQDGSIKTYEITFEIVTTDTSLKEVIVTGNKSGKEIPNNEKKAEEERKDYYFFVGEDPAEAKIKITPNDENAKVEIKKVGSDEFEEYDPDKVYGTGEYEIKVTASAGNSQTYTLVLEKFDGFKLADDADFALIALVHIAEDTDPDHLYRRTYDELGWTHGVDDLGVERYVLGEIDATDEHNNKLVHLVANFSPEQLSKICVYAKDGTTLLYDGAHGGIQSGTGDTEADLICTGWKIVYGSGSTADIIYVSVLGDVDGNGKVQAIDASNITTHILKDLIRDFDLLEVKLAARLTNTGIIGAKDSSTITSIVVAGQPISTYLRAQQQLDESAS